MTRLTSRRIRRRVAVAAALPMLLFGLSACGGDQEKTPEAATDVLDDWLTYFGKGSSKACDLETDDYNKAFNESFGEFSDDGDTPTCKARVLQAKILAEAFDEDLSELASATFETIDDGKDRVVIEATYEDGDAERYAMAYEDGEWLVDGDSSTDEDLEIADDSDSSQEFDEDEMTDEEAQEQADAWMAEWCSVLLGMTREDAIDLMGEPTDEYTIADDSDPQLHWSLGAYDFTVFLDTDGIINSFGGSYDSLGQSDLAKLPCVSLNEDYDILERNDG